MAEEKIKVVLERTYNVPLRKEFQKAPKYKRAKKASTALKQFLSRHMKSENIKLGTTLNMKLWERGIKNPPHHVNVSVKKMEDGAVMADLVGAEKETKKTSEPKKSEAKKTPEPKKPEKTPDKPTAKKEAKPEQTKA